MNHSQVMTDQAASPRVKYQYLNRRNAVLGKTLSWKLKVFSASNNAYFRVLCGTSASAQQLFLGKTIANEFSLLASTFRLVQ